MIAAPVVKMVIRRSEDFHEEMTPTIAARITAGPTLLAGATAYIIAARKMKASAIDFSHCPTPSAPVTETLNWLAAKVKRIKPANGVRPVQPVSGSPVIDMMERINSTEASAATEPRSARVFQFPSGIAKSDSFQRWRQEGRLFSVSEDNLT